MMKKLLCSLITIVILTNFIISNICNALTDSPPGLSSRLEGTEVKISDEAADGILNDGNAQAKGSTVTMSHSNFGVSVLGMVVGYIAMLFNVVPITLHLLMSVITMDLKGDINTEDLNSVKDSIMDNTFFTINKAIFNEIPLFNTDFFNMGDTIDLGTGNNTRTLATNDSNTKLKESIAEWFIICRLLAIIISLGVLIYVGIRMALSTIASDQAKYKKMLVSWVESVVILFLLQYIIIALLSVGEIFNNVCYSLRSFLYIDGQKGFEAEIIDTMYLEIFQSSGLKVALYSIMLWCLVFVQFKFFFTYIKRFLIMGFLIIISPLITITYPIDKMGDNRAQAFSTWFKEFMVNVFIQPLHAMIYLVFIFSAGKIAETAPLIGIIFLLSMGRIEKMIKTIFSLRGMTSIKSIDDTVKK